MKKLALIFLAIGCFGLTVLAQVPDAFKYQAVVRNSASEIISGQEVSLKISILNESSTGEVVYSEEHSETTSDLGMVSLNIGDGTIISGNFQSIAWGDGDKYLKIEIDESGGSSFSELGTFQLLSVPYALFANSASKLGNNVLYSTSPDTLFVVKDQEGNPVFVVYPDGAEVITNEVNKGKIGGFAVSGRTSTKSEEEYFRITPDSSRIYVNELSSKGKVGGFAVSGRTSTKGLVNDYLFVTADSTRIYVNDSISNKGKIGGFAVSGRTSSKASSVKYLDITEKNYFIGHSSGQKLTSGTYNNTLGYNSGFELTTGSNNAFIGYYAGRSNSTGYSNVFIGNNAGHSNSTGDNNVFLGYYAGYTNNANNNVFLGNEAGRYNSSGTNNAFIGFYAGRSNTTGTSNVYIGNSTFQSNSVANQNVAIGNGCAADVTSSVNSSIIMGDNALTGILANNIINSSMFIGKNAGINIGEGSGSVNNCIFLGTNSGDGVKNTHYSGIWSIVAVGNYSGSNTNGWRNVFIGDEAGMDFDGSYNTMIGFNVGQRGGSGEYNVYVGDQAALLAHGSNNTYIGRTAGSWVNGDNNVFLGYNAGRAAWDNPRTESNRLRIGSSNLIYGEFDNKRLSLNGNVGVNRDAYSSVSLAVSPNSQSYGIYVDAGSALYAGYFNGNIHATGSSTSSDIRFKRDIQEIENPIDKIIGIRGVTYFWDTDKFKDRGFTNEKQIGVIAQEVEKYLPELVKEDEDGYKSVSYDKLSAVLIEAVKEQQNQIDDLKSENKELKQKLNEIIKMLEEK